jgi:hypothetical protein
LVGLRVHLFPQATLLLLVALVEVLGFFLLELLLVAVALVDI